MNNDPYGILIVDKDKNMTSHDVVAIVRKRFAFKKVGHAGTLDPNATGVLVLLIGKATKLSDKFLNQEKEYVGIMKLGESTDSGDSDGAVLDVKDINVSEEDIKKAVSGFQGEAYQRPPMYSAKQVKGERLYDLARRGIEVERESVKVEIKRIMVEDIELPYVTFRVVCSKGTYIRQLASDIGGKLGCGAHLVELRRTRSGEFRIEQGMTMPEIKKLKREELEQKLVTV